MTSRRCRVNPCAIVIGVLLALAFPWTAGAQDDLPGPDIEPTALACQRVLRADVVAIDQVFFWNRLGAVEPQGMMYALRRDVVHINQDESTCTAPVLALQAGQVRLRRTKRPRPLVLRLNVGDCLQINFQNLLHPNGASIDSDHSPRTRSASIHVVGMPYTSATDAGFAAGDSTPASRGVVGSGGSTVYTLYAQREGTFMMYSGAATVGGEAISGSISNGLFGAVHVEPAGSEWYRSQVTQKELAFTGVPSGSAFPAFNYDATYPLSTDPEICRRTGLPILKMLGPGNEIVHTDLTAIITGPNKGYFGNGYPGDTLLYPERREPFREFTIIFHDEVGAVQAFPEFEDDVLQFTLHSVRDAFAINYGAAGAGAEVFANRLGVGPMFDCAECKYEEFFLSSWAVGDPAMVVDVPANAPCMVSTNNPHTVRQDPGFNPAVANLRDGVPCAPTPGRKATKAFFPDDPSNVYHSYLNDHVKFRNLHAGSDDHHIFHLHAHQWLHTPKSDDSSYLDSQSIGQGAGYTYEIAHEGSGNLNKTVGDSIFHCHFYPHFAQGMWSLWRVHDVLETGTVMTNKGRPAAGSRALPDNEILAGTPIPAIVPIPVLPMAPLPGTVSIVPTTGQVDLTAAATNPGYPFFVPGLAGRRAPQPPLDTIDDGGLPRHVVTDGTVAISEQTRLSFRKVLDELGVDWLDELGEPIEKMAMNFHANAAGYTTRLPTGGPAPVPFEVNGHDPVRGAPFADPCPAGSYLRTIKGADIQIDATLNKAGWHFPQTRMISLWEDVDDYVFPAAGGAKPPEPLFMRAHSGDCVEYWFTNLVPSEYQLDDFQVLTPTDILGQHIHLVKFDVLASDGGGNGFNYEDGSFSPEEVQERIHAIRKRNGCDLPGAPASLVADPTLCPHAEAHPFFNKEVNADCDKEDDWLGAQTTVQRWFADPVTRLQGGNDTLRTVFTHDHFGPSTHQQTGLYAGLVVEKPGTTWLHNETGTALATQHDGSPTSWQAVIQGTTPADTYREFLLEFADFQLAYEKGGAVCPDKEFGFADPDRAINPPGRKLIGPPLLYKKPKECPTKSGVGGPLPPCPEAVSADDPGMGSVNYRSEPLALRVRNPLSNTQATGLRGDLAFAYESRTDRADTDFNVQPNFYLPLTSDLHPGDPYTPMLRAYEGDQLRVKVLVGAHEEEHEFNVHGLKWLAEPDDTRSGWRNGQMMGISEWFDIDIPPQPSLLQDGDFADLLYKPSAATEFQWNGVWGLTRFYRGVRGDLVPLSKNSGGRVPDAAKDDRYLELTDSQAAQLNVVRDVKRPPAAPVPVACPPGAPLRPYDITAVWSAEVLANDGATVPGLIYNPRSTAVDTAFHDDWDDPGEPAQRFGPLHDSTAIMFVHTTDLTWSGLPSRPRLNQNVRREPLILRAVQGECIQVTLRNALPKDVRGVIYKERDGWNAMPMIVEDFNANSVKPSMEVSLHPQLVYYDVRQSDGTNVGLNPTNFGVQTVSPNQSKTYHWYAGQVTTAGGVVTAVPIEFGSTGLTSADPIKHTNKGAVGALIIEPAGATWALDTQLEQAPAGGTVERLTRASATVSSGGGSFREFVMVYQDDVNLRYENDDPVESLLVNEDPTESAQKAINYRSEPIWFRLGKAPDTELQDIQAFTNLDEVATNAFVGDWPATPIFQAQPHQATRVRVVHPGGHTQSHAFELQGHVWEELPYLAGSQSLGTNNNSEWQGVRGGHGPSNHFDALLKGGAGGAGGLALDYLYRDYPAWLFYGGVWGLLHVGAPIPDPLP